MADQPHSVVDNNAHSKSKAEFNSQRICNSVSYSGKLFRFPWLRMASSSHVYSTTENGVQLQGYTPADTSNVSLKDALNGEKEEKQDEIIGPTGTVRGIKNIIKERREKFIRNGAPETISEETEKDDGKIIVYTTSMGGIRSTVEECRFVRKLFDNLNLRVDERDIFMHKEYQLQLDQRLGINGLSVSVPQVFVNGVCLGGMEELLHLNETGQLKELLSGFKKLDGSVCSSCGGLRYINCSSCKGSKTSRKTRISREISVLKCTMCNENGLQRCPECT